MTYTLGLDIGIASVGWGVLAGDHIIDLGVRAFDKAETAKEGESLNLARRMARLMRRRLYRRAERLKKLARCLKRHGLIDDARFFSPQHPWVDKEKSLWRLRVDGLDRRLAPEEWARVIYHLVKHRGFHWISKAEEKAAEADSKGEGGKVKQSLAETRRRMDEKRYRSAAEMVLAEFPEAQRNKRGEYNKALSRVWLGQELATLFAKQREFGNPHADAGLEAEILGNGDRKSGIFWMQKPILSGDDLLKMLGRCTFEKDEYRAPKASFTVERHIWLTRLNNLRIVVDGQLRPLNEEERKLALPLPYAQASELTYKQLRTVLTRAGLQEKDAFRFAGLSYPSERQKTEEKAKDPEAATLVKLPAWQTLRSTLEKAGLVTEWQGMAGAAQDGRPEQLDEIARVLSVYKEGDEVVRELEKLALPGGEKMVEALAEVSFDKFSNLSLKALRKIVPFMERGQRYDEACVSATYHHSQLNRLDEEKERFLPAFYSGRGDKGQMVFRDDMDIPRNPVVLRALNQARKVVNAIVRRHGSPMAVHIEMARDLSRPLDERREIEKEQGEYRKRNDLDKEEFARQFGIVGRVDGRDFEKWRLYREQGGKCAYSQAAIELHRLCESGYVEVDHALPYSRSFDDSKNNKVLVLIGENRDKGNRTPYEYLTTFPGGEEGERWRAFEAFVKGNKSYRQAKRNRLLKKHFSSDDAKDFRDRNLNDTRYICRFFKNYLERHLMLESRADASTAQRCVVLSGQMTAFLRARWGLLKIRAESDRHHALDAAVVAACSHAMVKRLSDYSRRKELEQVRQGFVDVETGEVLDIAALHKLEKDFPAPWPHFHHELQARLKIDDAALLKSDMERLGTYSAEELDALRPVFVSRAVQKRKGGELHAATLHAESQEKDKVIEKLPLQKLTLKKVKDIVGYDNPRNVVLIAALEERLKNYGDDGGKAFAEPFYKPAGKKGKLGPVVRSIQVFQTQKSGMRVHRGDGYGVADLGAMLHVDVYQQGAKYFIKPVYEACDDVRLNSENVPEGAKFLFSLRKNDYLEIILGGILYQGYFVMYETDGRLTMRAHDQPQPDKKYFRKSIALATLIRKFHVDILGHRYLAHPEEEPRRGLA
jgi:CRISPR-associated endonuclease Csn1